MVRIYDNWDENRTKFEQLTVILDVNGLIIDPNDIGQSGALVLMQSDQQDEVVRNYVGLGGRAWRYPVSSRITLPKQKCWTTWIFRDALGNPLDLASVRVTSLESASRPEKLLRKTEHVTDEQGKMCRLVGSQIQSGRAILVSHPDYDGTAAVTFFTIAPVKEVIVGTVPKDSEAEQRTIRGFIVDEVNEPICGAVVKCSEVYTTGGGIIYGVPCGAITDENGWFRLYMPLRVGRSTKVDFERIIPPGSYHVITVEAPEEFALVPTGFRRSNNSDCVIKMTEPGRFHTFVFKGEQGILTSGTGLGLVELWVERVDEPPVKYEFSDWYPGGYFPLGTYKAYRQPMRGPNGQKIEGLNFKPIDVNEKSPEELLFTLGNDITYRGVVLNGTTGEPMKGAFIMTSWYDDLSCLTDEDWQGMHQLPLHPSMDDPALRSLHTTMDPFGRDDVISVKRIVRTDANGLFEMGFKYTDKPSTLAAFEKDYLGTSLYVNDEVPDANGIAELRLMPLFPAGKIFIEPCIEIYNDGKPCLEASNVGIFPTITLADDANNPDWVGRPFRMKYADEQLWQDESFVIDTNTFPVEPDISSEQFFNPTTMFLYGIYDFFTTQRVSLFGLPIHFSVSYNEPVSIQVTQSEPNVVFGTQDEIEGVVFESEEESDGSVKFYEMYEGYTMELSICKPQLKTNHRQSYYVPAGFAFRLKLITHYDEGWCMPEFSQTINLKQGETLELGRVVVDPAMLVTIKVVDSNGIGLEGIPLRKLYEEANHHIIVHNTDHTGSVMFDVCPNSKLELRVGLNEELEKAYKFVSYDIGGQEDAGKEFVLELSDEMIKKILQ